MKKKIIQFGRKKSDKSIKTIFEKFDPEINSGDSIFSHFFLIKLRYHLFFKTT